MADAEGPGDVREGLTRLPSRQRLTPLMRIERRRPSHVDALGLRALSPFACSGADQLPLKLRQPAEHGQHQPPVRRGGMGPGIREGTQSRARLADRVKRVEQVPRRSRQPVKPSDKEEIAGS